MENWNYAHAASRGTIARRHPYNYEMGLGREMKQFEDNDKKWSGDHSASDAATTQGFLVTNEGELGPDPAIADNTSAARTLNATAATKRGARFRKLRSKRAPSAQPSRSCAAFVSPRGTADQLTSAMVSGIATASAPSTNAFATRARSRTSPPTNVEASSASNPRPRTSVAPG